MPRAELESIRGFLVYVARTYWDMVAYLKGLHLTIDIWRHNRGHDEWKLVGVELEEAMDRYESGEERLIGPTLVKGVERLEKDLVALAKLTESPELPLRRVRVNKAALAVYLPGDASNQGFGSALIIGNQVEYETGEYTNLLKEESSNYHEAENLVMRMERGVEEKRLLGCKLFIFTDNIVFEGGFYKGPSITPNHTKLP